MIKENIFGIKRFLKLTSNKQLDVYYEPLCLILMGILLLEMSYSFKHKCWIGKF